MNQDKTIRSYKFLNPIDAHLFEKGEEKELRDEFVYLQAHFLKDMPKIDRNRKYYRLVNGDNFIIRQVRGLGGSKNFLKYNDDYPITMSYLNEIELDISNGDTVQVEATKSFDTIRYFFRHPSRDVRIASCAISLGFILGIISIGLGIWGVVLGYGT